MCTYSFASLVQQTKCMTCTCLPHLFIHFSTVKGKRLQTVLCKLLPSHWLLLNHIRPSPKKPPYQPFFYTQTVNSSHSTDFRCVRQIDQCMTSKYHESYREQTATYAFKSLSWYFDVILRSTASHRTHLHHIGSSQTLKPSLKQPPFHLFWPHPDFKLFPLYRLLLNHNSPSRTVKTLT